MTINDTWAYNKHDRDYKTSDYLIRGLVEVASRGGNLLLNVGPQPDGIIQPQFQDRLRAIGNWLAVNGESIYGTTYGPVQNVTAFRTTAKHGKIFVHVLDWKSPILEVNGIGSKVTSTRFLDGGKVLKFSQAEGRLQIQVPDAAPDSDVSVISLTTL